MPTQQTPRHLTPRQVAQRTGLTTGALTMMRKRRKGPPFIRLKGCRAILYLSTDIDAWIAEGRVETKKADTPNHHTTMED